MKSNPNAETLQKIRWWCNWPFIVALSVAFTIAAEPLDSGRWWEMLILLGAAYASGELRGEATMLIRFTHSTDSIGI